MKGIILDGGSTSCPTRILGCLAGDFQNASMPYMAFEGVVQGTFSYSGASELGEFWNDSSEFGVSGLRAAALLNMDLAG